MTKLSGWCARGLATMLLVAAAGGATAADLGFYVVVDGTSNSALVSGAEFRSNIAVFLEAPEEVITNVRIDTKAKRYAMTVGYQLGTYFAIEGTYLDLGKIRYDYIATGGTDDEPVDYPGTLTIKPKGPTVSAVGFLPLGDYFSLDGRAGFSFVDSKFRNSINNVKDSFSLSKTGLYYGAGVAWWVTGQVALRVGYNRFERALAVFDGKTNQYTLGIRYSYGY